MIWHVVSYVGDFMLENQPEWTREYTMLLDAENAARRQHASAKEWCTHPNEIANIYTVVQDEDGEVMPFLMFRDEVLRGSRAKQRADAFCQAAA